MTKIITVKIEVDDDYYSHGGESASEAIKLDKQQFWAFRHAVWHAQRDATAKMKSAMLSAVTQCPRKAFEKNDINQRSWLLAFLTTVDIPVDEPDL